MNIQKVKISEVKTNDANPRVIKDDKFLKLVQSIKDFPKMLELRPIIVNDDMVVLGGNMRLRAAKDAGLKHVPIIKASDLTEEEQQQFIIKDNVSFGEWDWDILANIFDAEQLAEWGLDVWTPPTDVDYSILDDENLEKEISEMAGDVKKAIQIEFEAEHYEQAQELVKFWRDKGLYIGGLLIEKLKEEKQRHV
jgi:ParB-like chromosome segregation protein Spo0J